MTGVVLWKEVREQRSIWLAMVGAAWLALAGLPVVFSLMGVTPSGGMREYLAATLAVLVWTYGLVCGGMLLAGERESGAIHFLDNLPGLRLRLWRSKANAGVVLVAAQAAAVAGLAIAYQLPTNPREIAGGIVALLAAGLLGYGWGMLVSANGSNVLNCVALAIFYQPVAAGFVYAIVYVAAVILALFLRERGNIDPLPVSVVAGALLIALPILGSALIFSATDRDRQRSPGHRVVRRKKAAPRESKAVLLWLTYMQSRRLMIGLVLCCAVGGFVLLTAGLALWIAGSLLVGVVCGVTVFMDEQTRGAFRFLGDQRFPLGRIWWLKVGYHFLLACAAALLLLLPGLVRETGNALSHTGREPFFFLEHLFQSALLRTLIPGGICLGLWLFYGFSIGHLCGLLFRRSLIAFVVALMTAAMVSSVWLPSMLGGGLHGWQVWGVPVILVVLARLLMHAWATDRLLSRIAITRLGAGLLLCVLWIAGSLWYRVLEVPNVPDHWDMPAFVASLPTPEQNKAGMKIRGASAELEGWMRQHANLKPTRPLFRGEKMEENRSFSQQLSGVLARGWPEGQPELGGWLDKVFAAKWPQDLATIPELPLGVVDDPRNQTFRSLQTNIVYNRMITELLAVRGLEKQAGGDPNAFVNYLRISLAVSRNLRHDALLISALVGWSVEAVQLQALERWLEKLDGQPEMLRRTLTLLLRHEAQLPDEEAQSPKAEYLLVLNSVDQPETFLEGYRPQEVEMYRLAGHVPWERERRLRLLRGLYEGNAQERERALRLFKPDLTGAGDQRHLSVHRKVTRVRLHAAQLQVALRLYQAETGKPAASLDALMPKYLRHIPTDPFDGKPFRYRLSQGERITWVPEAQALIPQPLQQRRIPPGQGILWSIGADGHDDGGRRKALVPVNREPGEDLIFLVPLPPRRDK